MTVPSKKVTVPTAVTGLPVTLAVKVTLVPTLAVGADVATAVTVVAGETTRVPGLIVAM